MNPTEFRRRSAFGRTRNLAPILCVTVLIAGLVPGSSVQAQSAAARITFANSIKEPVTEAVNAPLVAKNAPTTVRSQLTDAETQATIDFSIALKMRNFAELQQRTGRGEIIPLEEMSAKYFPTSADIESVRAWLRAQGFELEPPAEYELSVFARGTVTQLQRAFGVTFARVQFRGEEHTSAVTAPSLPADVARPVLSINGLQPHLHPFVHSVRKAVGVGKLTGNQPPYLVSEIAKAYDGLFADGTGQKIGIVIDTFPKNSDLTTFWADNGVPQSLNNIEKVQVVSGTLAAPSGEETLDVSWSSGIASAARVRVYATTDLSFTHLDQAYQFIINELNSQPQLHQISLSYGLGETYMPAGEMDTDAGYFMTIAGQGVSVFVSSGDGGSSPDSSGHNNTGPLQIESPSDDPNVTAVGGTTMYLNTSTGAVASEFAWSLGGGGQSQHFSRPTWQPGTRTIPALSGFTGRLVPDVALDADPNTGVFLCLNGDTSFQWGGTSLSSPVWAGICARINQLRSNRATSSLGLLGSKIYPLLGSSRFTDITTGSNGTYSAGTGFDLCTGVGVPDIDNLINALEGALPNGTLANGSFIPRDLNGDGQADLVFENTANGQRGIWLMHNGVVQSSTNLGTVDPSWHIAAIGDFLGNGQSDLLWENTSGGHAIWIFSNGAPQYSINLPTAGGGWHVVGAGDFNGDGQADLVWENSVTGHRAIWLMNSGVYVSSIDLGTVSTQWHIAGVGDFLNNGQSDLVWENSAGGQRAIWLMNNGVFQSAISLGTVSTQWHIAGAADFSGDAKADLVWENSVNGQRAIWVMNNGVFQSVISLPTISAQWHIVEH
jgi:kumamolisin